MKNKILGFKCCADCTRKVKVSGLSKGEYYCSQVKDFIPNGIVYDDTDATECIAKGFFKPSDL